MAVKTQLVLALFEELSNHTQFDLQYSGFKDMEDYLECDDITQRYLYDTYNKALKALDAGQVFIGTKPAKLNLIAQAMEYRNFLDFELTKTNPVDPMLKSCEGNWWSLARGNTGEAIFKAPVHIEENVQKQMIITLRGQSNKFRGVIKINAGCMFCHLDSDRNKKMLIILKGNVNKHSQVLQGVFSGISSTGDPIAGRELFIREHVLPLKDMKWQALALDDVSLDPRIRKYFENPKDNCIKIDNQADLG